MIYTVLISTRLILNLCRIQLFLAISVEIRTSTTIIQYNSAGEGGADSATAGRSGCSHQACRGVPGTTKLGSAGEKLLIEMCLKDAEGRQLASALFTVCVCQTRQMLLQEPEVLYCPFPARSISRFPGTLLCAGGCANAAGCMQT